MIHHLFDTVLISMKPTKQIDKLELFIKMANGNDNKEWELPFLCFAF